MPAYPLVSIVTPSFNQGHFLEATIQSVLRQDYPHIEYIIMDGGSTDNSVEVIRAYEERVAYWISEKDKGQSHAINKGFAKAHGEILAWLNSDDLLAPSAVRIATHFLMRDEATGIVYGDRVHLDTRGNVIGIRKLPHHDKGMFRKNFTLPQETVFFKHDVLDRAGKLDEDLHFSMDFDLWCRMSRVTSMKHIPAFTGFFREHPQSKSVEFRNSSHVSRRTYESEHAEVYRRHFSRDLPSGTAMTLYRLQRLLLLLRAMKSRTYHDDKQTIRALSLDTFLKT